MKKWIISLLFLAIQNPLFAQQTTPISLAELEQKSLDQNLQVQLAQKEAQLAQAELLQSKSAYLPNITASYTYTNTNSPLMAFGTKLNQARIEMMDFNPD